MINGTESGGGKMERLGITAKKMGRIFTRETASTYMQTQNAAVRAAKGTVGALARTEDVAVRGIIGAAHLAPATVDNKYVRGGARLAYGLGKSSLERWVHNFDPRGRGDKIDKALWGAGIGFAFAESHVVAPLGPAGGWMKAGLNFVAVQGISIGLSKYFERQEKNFIAKADRANAFFGNRVNVIPDVDTRLANIQRARQGRNLVADPNIANVVSGVDTELAKIQRRRAIAVRRVSNFFAGVSAGNSIASIVHFGDLGLSHFAGTDNLGELFVKAIEAHSANTAVATGAATAAATAVKSATKEAASSSFTAPSPAPETLAPHPSPTVEPVASPSVPIPAEATPAPASPAAPLPTPTEGGIDDGGFRTGSPEINVEDALSGRDRLVFDTLKNNNVIAGAARDMMGGYGDYLSPGVDETHMGGIGQQLVDQIMQTNHLEEASRIQVEAMVKKVIEEQANLAFRAAVGSGYETDTATVDYGVRILKTYLGHSDFQQSLAENASRRFAQIIQEITTTPEAFQPADIAHLSGVSDDQALDIMNNVLRSTPGTFKEADFSGMTDLDFSNFKQAVFESITHDVAPKLLEQSHAIETLPLDQALGKAAEVGTHLPTKEIAENLSKEFKNVTGILAQLTDTQLDSLDKVLNKVSTATTPIPTPPPEATAVPIPNEPRAPIPPPIDRMEAIKAIILMDPELTAAGITIWLASMPLMFVIALELTRKTRRRRRGGPSTGTTP